jgi:transposase
MNTPPYAPTRCGGRDLFESLDRPTLRPLPETEWEYAKWDLCRVGIDYHVEVDGFYYSVPHALIRAEVDVRITTRIVEVIAHPQIPGCV